MSRRDYKNYCTYPAAVVRYAERHNLTFQVATWFTDRQYYGRWHYDGPHKEATCMSGSDFCSSGRHAKSNQEHRDRGLIAGLCSYEYPEKAILIKEHRDENERPIHIEAYICERTKPSEHKVYRPKTLIFDWRNNPPGCVGIYNDLTDSVIP